MTLQEAIKTGKPFRRKGWNYWLVLDVANYITRAGTYLNAEFKAEDILADDWEIKKTDDMKADKRGMTIQEAIKSGKPFKRRRWSSSFWLKEDEYGRIVWEDSGGCYTLLADEILADDWEVKGDNNQETS